mgnify:CR=1 FL=1
MNDLLGGASSHKRTMLNYSSLVKTSNTAKANKLSLPLVRKAKTIRDMTPKDTKPFLPIARRLRWHREDVEGMIQADYAEAIGVKRTTYSLWEAGNHRLSLDGALALRKKYGLSLDFLYEGIDDALPMTLRKAWRERL